MQKGTGVLPMWEKKNCTWDDAEADNSFNAAYAINDGDESIPLDLLQLGKAEIRRQHDIMTKRNTITNLGWTRESHNAISNPDIESPPIECILSDADWKHEVDKKKQEVLEQQRQHMPPDETKHTETSSQVCTPNIVKIADKSYLTKNLDSFDA
jgi:hypothetical protein